MQAPTLMEMAMAWMIFLYAVNTHEPLPVTTHRYQTEELCRLDARVAQKNGVSYAICRRVL